MLKRCPPKSPRQISREAWERANPDPKPKAPPRPVAKFDTTQRPPRASEPRREGWF